MRPTGRVLELDTLRHSYVDLADPTYLDFRYIRGMAAVADLVEPAGHRVRALYLGGGGFTLPRYVQASRPGSMSRVLEIDGEVVRLAEREVGLQVTRNRRGSPDNGGAQVEVDDARTALAEQPRPHGISLSATPLVGSRCRGT